MPSGEGGNHTILGVTDGYFGEGYTLAQKKDALETITLR
jgi:hypothetical protein